MARNIAGMGERNAYSLLVKKPEGKIPPERQKRRQLDSIGMYLGELG
jgi:hypothetical protein